MTNVSANVLPQALAPAESTHELVALFLSYFHPNKLSRGICHGRAEPIDLLQLLLLINIDSGEKVYPFRAKVYVGLDGKLILAIGGREPGAHRYSKRLLLKERQEEHHQHYSSESEPEIPVKLNIRLP